MRNDLSNLPAKAVCYNVGALCTLPGEPSIIDRVFRRQPGPVAIHRPAQQITTRLLAEGYNQLLLVEQPALWEFAQNMVVEHNLPITKAFLTPDWDHYAVVTGAYTVVYTLWISEKLPPFDRAEIIHSTSEQGWYTLYDTMRAADE